MRDGRQMHVFATINGAIAMFWIVLAEAHELGVEGVALILLGLAGMFLWFEAVWNLAKWVRQRDERRSWRSAEIAARLTRIGRE